MFRDTSVEYTTPYIHLNSEPKRSHSLDYKMEVKDIIESILDQNQETQMKRLERILHAFIQTLQNDQSINPRFVELLDDTITSHPQFQSVLFDIMVESTKDGRVEEFLRLSTEYSMIFRIRDRILQNDSIQTII